MGKSDHTVPSEETRAEEEHEAHAGHGADRPPTAEEEADAPVATVDPGGGRARA